MLTNEERALLSRAEAVADCLASEVLLYNTSLQAIASRLGCDTTPLRMLCDLLPEEKFVALQSLQSKGYLPTANELADYIINVSSWDKDVQEYFGYNSMTELTKILDKLQCGSREDILKYLQAKMARAKIKGARALSVTQCKDFAHYVGSNRPTLAELKKWTGCKTNVGCYLWYLSKYDTVAYDLVIELLLDAQVAYVENKKERDEYRRYKVAAGAFARLGAANTVLEVGSVGSYMDCAVAVGSWIVARQEVFMDWDEIAGHFNRSVDWVKTCVNTYLKSANYTIYREVQGRIALSDKFVENVVALAKRVLSGKWTYARIKIENEALSYSRIYWMFSYVLRKVDKDLSSCVLKHLNGKFTDFQVQRAFKEAEIFLSSRISVFEMAQQMHVSVDTVLQDIAVVLRELSRADYNKLIKRGFGVA